MGISVKVFFIKEKKSYAIYTSVPRNQRHNRLSRINRRLQAPSQNSVRWGERCLHLESESLLSDEEEEEDDEEESELELLALRRDAAL